MYNLESDELTHHGKSIYDLNISDEEVTKATGIDSEGMYVEILYSICVVCVCMCVCARVCVCVCVCVRVCVH